MLSMSGCSATQKAARKLERARRLTERAAILDPESVKADTVFKLIPIYVPSIKLDTVFVDKGIPVIIEKDKLLIKYLRDTLTNEVFIEGECKADTIIKEVPVVVNKTAYIKQSFWRTAPGVVIIILFIAAFILAVLRFAFKII